MLIKNNKKILFVCAHPDDELLGCGGTIAKLKKNNFLIKIIFLAEGITARYNKSEFKTKKVLNEIDERNNNCLIANKVLGISKKDIIFFNYTCCRLDQEPLIEITKVIESELNYFKPSIVFTHNKDDINIDHRICFDATIAACRPVKNKSVERIYTFETPSSTDWYTLNTFKPQIFIDISDFLDLKIQAIKKYKKEIKENPHSRSIEKIKSLASYRGSYIGTAYSEAFQLIRSNDL